MRFVFTGTLVGAVLASATAAHACLNDTQTARAETEFRSQYEVSGSSSPGSATVFGMDLYGATAMAGGILLIAGAGAVYGRAVGRRPS